jgi:HSP20 family protein
MNDVTDVTKESKEGTSVTAPRSVGGGLLSFDEFDNFFDDFLSRRWLSSRPLWSGGVSFPRIPEGGFLKVDIRDYPDRIEVQAALPAGVNKDAVELSINNQVLTIRASSKEEKEEKEEGKYFRKEITRGEFQRTLSLPENVDEDKVTASCQDGILKVSIQKTEKTKPKTIEIS